MIATGFEQTRVAARRPVQAQQRVARPEPAPRVVQRPPVPEMPAEEAEVDVEMQQQPAARPVADDFKRKVYDTDDLDIPAFLRRR